MSYSPGSIEEKAKATLEECYGLQDGETVTWVNVDGVHDTSVIEQLGALVALHPLVLEDVVTLDQRPKLEEFDEHLFLVLKMLHYDNDERLAGEHVSLVVGHTFVISFQEYEGDVFEPVRSRLRKNKGRIRKMGADYLAYTLIDTVVDHYFLMIEQLGEQIESLEELLLSDPEQSTLIRINELKREVIMLRKSIWPLREVISGLQRGESPIFKKKTMVFLRNVYDHTIQVLDIVETYRDLLSGLTDLYMSSLSQKMNEVMQFLTIIGTIFIPLTFIAGVYGMNFEIMPELRWRYGYPIMMGLMAVMAFVLLIYFRRKKWL